jgi:hypothetical protein
VKRKCTTQEAEMGELKFEASSDKKIEKPYLKIQTVHGDAGL